MRLTLLAPLCAFAASGCGTGGGAMADCTTESADRFPDIATRWIEVWRHGGAGSPVELSMPMSVNVAPDGRLAIPDFQLGLVGFSASGEWLGSLTRSGEGPGEVGMPFAAAFDDGGNLSILDFANAKVVILQPTGELSREIRLDGGPLASIARSGALTGLGMAADGTTYVHMEEPIPGDGSILQTLLRIPAGGAPPDTIATSIVPSLASVWEGGSHIRAPGWPLLAHAVAPGGRIAFAGHEESYRIAIREPDGSRSTLCRAVGVVPLRPDETELPEVTPETADYDRALKNAPRPAAPAPVARLLLGRRGRVWVERERFGAGDPMGNFIGRPGSLFDVFDERGTLLGELRAPAGVHVVAVSGDRAWGLEYDEFDAPVVVAYRLDPPLAGAPADDSGGVAGDR